MHGVCVRVCGLCMTHLQPCCLPTYSARSGGVCVLVRATGLCVTHLQPCCLPTYSARGGGGVCVLVLDCGEIFHAFG